VKSTLSATPSARNSGSDLERLSSARAGLPPENLDRFLQYVWRHAWVVVGVVLLAISGMATWVLTRPPVYSSTARLISNSKIKLVDSGPSDDGQYFFGTQIELLQSRSLSRRARERALQGELEIQEGKVEVRARQLPRSTILIVEVIGDNSVWVQTFLEALVDEYLEARRAMRKNTSNETLNSLSREVGERQQQLRAAQEKLVAAQTEGSLQLLEEQNRTASAQLARLTVEEADIRMEQNLLDQIVRSANPDVGHRAVPERLPSTSQFNQLRERMDTLQVELEDLSRVLKPEHPKIQRLVDEQKRIQELLPLYRKQTIDQVATAQEALTLRRETIGQQIGQWQEVVSESSRKIAAMDGARMEVMQAQALYERLLGLLQNLDVNQNLDQETMSTLEMAREPVRKGRQVTRRITEAAGAGLLAALGLISLLARVDDRIYSGTQVASALGLELLGSIPEVDRAGKSVANISAEDERHAFVEAVRTLRSSLLFLSQVGLQPKIFMVASAGPGEGKSTVARNVARALALANARVLLIDADLRRGQLARSLEAKESPGLSELLSAKHPPAGPLRETPFSAEAGHPAALSNQSRERRLSTDWMVQSLQSMVQMTDLPKLHLLSSGRHTDSAGELFLGSSTDSLLQAAREEYDFVIMDSAPVLAADDTPALAPKVDGVLFVVAYGATQIRAAQAALEALHKRQTQVAGCVVNMDKASESNNYYYKYCSYNTRLAGTT
jgi:polysaccharide biosynthesis transport protein